MKADPFETDLEAQVITMFPLPSINMKLPDDSEPRRAPIVSNTFCGGRGADETQTVGGDCSSWCGPSGSCRQG